MLLKFNCYNFKMHCFVYVLAVNAVIGLLMFEWAWKRVERQRTVCEERDS